MLRDMGATGALRQLMIACILQTGLNIAEKSAEDSTADGVVIRTNKLWEQDNHMMLLFNYPRSGRMEETGDFTPVYRKMDLVLNQSHFKQICEAQRHLFKDYTKLSSAELLQTLAQIVGANPDHITYHHYALTLDSI